MGKQSSKKTGGRSNKKKKSQKNIISSTSTPHCKVVNLPTFHNKDNLNSEPSNGGIYERYKKSTKGFRDWMKKALPNCKLDAVKDLSRAADQILEKAKASLDGIDENDPPIVVPPEVMYSLETIIKLRVMTTETKYGNHGDEGHKFMVRTLKHCRRVLGLSRKVVRVAATVNADSDGKDSINEIGGRFNALHLDDSDHETSEDNDDIDEETIRRRCFPVMTAPEEPEGPIKYTIEEHLINGSDRFQACAFLSTMEDFMETVDQHYGLLKMTMRGEGDHETSHYLQLLMECAVVSNMATESVCAMETSLAADHPHLASFYNVLALVFLYPIIADIQKGMPPDVVSKQPHLAKTFAGDILECSFHNKGDQKMESKIKRFTKQSGTELVFAQAIADQISLTVGVETQLACEFQINAQLNAVAASLGCKPHMWFGHNLHLSGDRSILNTQNLIQKVFDVVQDNKKLMPKPDHFGPMWDARTNPARRIRGDMDQLFAGDILPELIEICKRAPIANLPNRMELMPVLNLLATQVRNKESPVPVSLTFGMHAILTSIMVLQGDGDLARLATYSKRSFNKLFAQLEERSDSKVSQSPSFYVNINLFKGLVNIAKPVKPVGSSTSEDHGFWNPVIGGEYLLFATYICSIGLGSATIDSLGQLRFTLHLYNALRKCKLIEEIPFLNMIDIVFENTKALWVGGRPEKGAFVKKFWLAWGASIEEATQRAANKHNERQDGFKLGKDSTRKLDEILPEEYSASYRRLVRRDFVDAIDNYSVTNVTDAQKERHKGLFDLVTRVNMTRDSMDDDEDMVIPTNFTQVGCILNEFICGLNKSMGWDSIIKKIISTCPDDVRNGVRSSGRRARVGGFETSDINMERQASAQFLATVLSELDFEEAQGDGSLSSKKVATFMTEFFGEIPKDRYTFFVDENNENTATSSAGAPSNPLEGSHPYGRTGRTVRDPLAAFCHCKYSKSGEAIVRLIKPGKRTPYLTDASPAQQRQREFDRSEHILNPYKEMGSKQPRQPNGRYRHIASYSIKELVALGWDGAMYSASQSIHKATGLWCPFVPGYDSDADNRYDPIDAKAGKRAGTIGLPRDEVGLFMEVPTRGIVKLNAGRYHKSIDF